MKYNVHIFRFILLTTGDIFDNFVVDQFCESGPGAFLPPESGIPIRD
jgi:hypothetical protein